MVVRARAIKNKSFTPNIEINLVTSFNRGYSNFWTNFLLLKEFKRITVGGAWCTLFGCEDSKFYQKEALTVYNENQKFRDAFKDQVNEIIQTEYIERYKNADETIEGTYEDTVEKIIEEEQDNQEEVFSEDPIVEEVI